MRSLLVSVITDVDQIALSSPYANMLEYRLDWLKEIPKAHLPVMFTFRKRAQGGALDISEEQRLNQLETHLSLQPEFCDLEADTDSRWIQRLGAKFPKVKFVGSYHNFSETPLDLEALFQSMQNPQFSFYKIACFAKTTEDMLRLFSFAQSKKNLTWIAMGKAGQPSRILAPLTGAPFCYGTMGESAPPLFQVNLQMLTELYRFSILNRDTKIYALIGNPIDASIGHLYHNSVFAEKNENKVYVKLSVLKEELASVFAYLKKLPFSGISVTMPYKTDIIPLLDEIDSDAKKIGAVNTISFRNGKAWGFNTDGLGAANAIERHLPIRGKKVALFGAGGASRALAYELNRRGAKLTIFNRTFETAEKLAAQFGGHAARFEEFASNQFDLLINSIPTPIDLEQLPPFVMDIAISSSPSSLLQKTRCQGCVAIEPKEMFYEQAKRQQEIWRSY